MKYSPFLAYYKSKELANEKLTPIFASAEIEIFPYQVAAALFALNSPQLGGCILCDEGALGKTYEAMLVSVQKWYEGQKVAIIVPTPLRQQWEQVITDKFGIELTDEFSLFTYDNYSDLESYNLVVIDEAHNLRNMETKLHQELGNATQNAYKLLLTATPMQNSIMDLYGLISFIDDSVLGDKDTFYKRYFRKPENYPELTDKVSRYAFRTTRAQVANYTKIPNRTAITVEYSYTKQEQALYEKLMEYIPNSPINMDEYELTLMLTRAFSSSISAFQNIASKHDEMAEFLIPVEKQSKPKALLNALKTTFTEIRQKGAAKKALIFVENKTTQAYLYDLLKEKYKTECYKDYSSIEKFRRDAQILIATQAASDGFNLEFCSLVVNYDLPYNTLEIEQRINRCHRQGQENDVVVLSFLNKSNFADVRTLELINKRMLQFNGIIGNSDQIIGNFRADIAEVIQAQTRTKAEIQAEFEKTLIDNKQDNTELVDYYENVLFSSFTKDAANSVQITPKYMAEIKEKLENDLWDLLVYFFEKHHFHINHETRTISCVGHPPKVFSGKSMGRNEYSMNPKYQPRSGRITLTSSIARSVMSEISWRGIPQSGTINANAENADIAFYCIQKGDRWLGSKTYQLVGQTTDGRTLTDKECVGILESTEQHSTSGEYIGGLTTRPEQDKHRLDSLVELPEIDNKDEIKRAQSVVDNEILRIKTEIKKAEQYDDTTMTRKQLMQAQFVVHKLKCELKEREKKQWYDKMIIKQNLMKNPDVHVWREFALDVKPTIIEKKQFEEAMA